MSMPVSRRKTPLMSDSHVGLAGLMGKASDKLSVVANRLKSGVASADELMECGKLASALAEAMELYAGKMPKVEPDGRHSLRQRPPST